MRVLAAVGWALDLLSLVQRSLAGVSPGLEGDDGPAAGSPQPHRVTSPVERTVGRVDVDVLVLRRTNVARRFKWSEGVRR